MKFLKMHLVYIFLSFLALHAQVDTSTIAFKNVNIIPMDTMQILTDYTVITSGGLITEIGPSQSVTIPQDAYIIEANDKYLMPGLTDMHVHIWDEDYLMHFLANGVTTIRNMWGESEHLLWRQEIRTGKRFGPELYTTGPILEGENPAWFDSRVITTVDQARNVVKQNKNDGYDFIKVYHTLNNKDVYDAIIDEAALQDIRVVGHPAIVTDSMWTIMEYAYATNVASIEHMHWYLNCVWQMPLGNDVSMLEEFYSEDIDSLLTARLLDLQIQAGAWSCPTLAVVKNYTSPTELAEAKLRPYVKYVKKRDIDDWVQTIVNRPSLPFDLLNEYRKNIAAKKMVKAMHDQGVKLLIGTDCTNPFVVWGFSVNEELQLFVEAGLTPFEVLTIATKNAAEFMQAEHIFGTVAEGLRADLILLNSNPLENIDNVQDQVGVMARGVWLSDAYLQEKVSPIIRVTPSPAQFAATDTGETTKKRLTIYNDGLSELVIDSIYTDLPEFQVIAPLEKIEAKYYRQVTISFTPESPGEFNGSVTFVTNDKKTPLSTIHLSGTGIDPTRVSSADNRLPTEFALGKNYPNPFNPMTKIKIALPKTEFATLIIYNMLGQRIHTLLDRKVNAGYYEVEFNASNLPSGVYYYQLRAGQFRDVKKMILLR